MENRDGTGIPPRTRQSARYELIVVLFAAAIFLGCIVSPPSLMDDVDAVQAQIARNMLESGDWVTARLNGITYLEKSPLVYWLIAASFALFGVHDWAARLPIALASVALCWLTARFGTWAFGARAGFYAGLSLATSLGLFLFTRILIPDVILTAAITLALWAFLRALDEHEARPAVWAAVMAASIGTGLLLKGLIAAVFPIAAAVIWLGITRQLFLRRTWNRLKPLSGALIVVAIAAPWHILATLQNPPYFDLTPKSEPGQYHGFFWFYFLNEHVFRFLNMRHPRDYNTVPRHLFWLLHLLWLFPWSAYLPALGSLDYRGSDRAARTRLLALCWAGFLLTFFTFSTTQEYYSMPCYPAIALLLGCAMSTQTRAIRIGTRIIGIVAALSACAIAFLLTQVWNLPTPGDISRALTQNPEAYTLSLGHLGDLTIDSFAYLRTPLILAGVACLLGVVGQAVSPANKNFPYVTTALMIVVFLHAARLAMVVFDPYLSSRPLAEALNRAPAGQLIVDNQYYTFSSVFFYTNRRALLLNGRVNNLEYGSYAPGAPGVFRTDQQLSQLWRQPQRYYLLVEKPAVPRIQLLVGRDNLHTVASAGGKFLFTNHADLH